MPVSFAIDDVGPALAALPTVAPERALRVLLGELPERQAVSCATGEPVSLPAPSSGLTIEAMSNPQRELVAVECHPLIAAAQLAYDAHRALSLSPDHIWCAIAQAFGEYVRANAERVRHRFTRDAGKVTICVRRDDFVAGAADNPWPEVFATFSAQIRGHIGAAQHDLLVPAFSTTDATARAVCDAVLMDTVQCFFDYRLMTMCGIPRLTLEGTRADWESIVDRVQAFREFPGLEWWLDPLDDALARFVAAFDRADDPDPAWRDFVKVDGLSGGPYLSGWINVLVPWLADGRRNPVLEALAEAPRERHPPTALETLEVKMGLRSGRATARVTSCELPTGLSRVPFVWVYLGAERPMTLLAGFVGVEQDPTTLALRPALGWAVG